MPKECSHTAKRRGYTLADARRELSDMRALRNLSRSIARSRGPLSIMDPAFSRSQEELAEADRAVAEAEAKIERMQHRGRKRRSSA